MTIGPDQNVSAFYRHGWQSWSETRWRDVAEPVHHMVLPDHRAIGDDPVHSLDDAPGGSAVGAVRGPDGTVTLLGALGLGAWVTLRDGALHGATEAPEGSWFSATGDEVEVFSAYAKALSAVLGRRPRRGPQNVWCSWYSFYHGIDAASLGKVLNDLDGLDVDVFQIDDGWQQEIGDWNVASDRFDDGLPAFVERIRGAGRAAGLWIAPFMVSERASLVIEHPEWVLRDGAGAPVNAGWNWHGRCYGLDLSRDDVLDHVRGVISRAVSWGFTYLKLDFLYAGALPAIRSCDVHREQAYRDGIEAIRKAAGDDTYLLACGAPLIASIGVFDGARVGPDVAEYWENTQATLYLHNISGPNTRYAIATSAHRLWMDEIWDVDPDVTYFRSRYCLLTQQQKALLTDLTRICGFRGTSDVPAWLDADERAALAAWYTEDIEVTRTGPLTWRVGERDVDLRPVASDPPRYLPVPAVS